MKKGRNTKCHCGSGKKYKHCHESKDSKNSNQYFLIGSVCFVFIIIFFLSTRKENNSQESFISKTPISFESEFKRRKAPEGDPPPGKVWSVEHGHWHDINPPNGSVDGH